MFKKGLLLGTTALLLSACGAADETTEDTANEGTEETTEETVTIRVASHLPPMTDIVEIAGDVIEDGYEVELVEVSDNIQYNEALLNEEVDANFAQHEPFMEMFNEERDGNLVTLQPIYNAIVGFYSPVYDSVEDIEDGAEVAIPSDPTNEARALITLEEHDLIKLDPEVSKAEVTDTDVVDNPYNFTFTHVDLLNLTASYEDGVELVFNLPTYIAAVDLTPEDAVILQADEQNRFAITLVAREDNQDSEEIQALVDAMTSQEVYDFLDELAENGHLRPAFEPGE
ncbi:MetQ/NlpA family ABC transporter substrate-binding protein [Alkalibacterium putridalgicola]|uniref:MetQ/NlpA family ABC transporter substrate-binding protein n=1 Tax=Alkalibacterium putridalgicola TaxID=426703 RepID=UPI0034CF82D3